MLAILIAIYLLIILLELPALVKNQMKKELIAFTLIFSLGVYMSLAQFFGWWLVNPFEPWIRMLQP